jgi:hypothetical protein
MFRTGGFREEIRLSLRDPRAERADSRPQAGPWGTPAPEPPDQPPPRAVDVSGHKWRRLSSAAFFVLILLVVGARAYKDLSRPEAWAYWKDLYFSPGMTSSLIIHADPDGSGHTRSALVITGTIGAATASWFRDRLGEAHLVAGDAVLLSSPGGDLNQALIMGEIIRSRGLVTAVGVADPSGHIRPSYCASACVLVYAGGRIRIGIGGSMLGVHRFVTLAPGQDPVAETQRTAGLVLNYMTRMGVSSSVVEAMSATTDVRWLGAGEAAAMNLVTDPVARP